MRFLKSLFFVAVLLVVLLPKTLPLVRAQTSDTCSLEEVQNTALRVIYDNGVDCPLQSGKKCFHAGGFWNQFWVRDTSYSSLMGLWSIYPEELKNTFIELVLMNGKSGYPAQDGAADFGRFPYQTDSIVWVIGAFETAKMTNDPVFRKYVYEVAKKMLPVWKTASDSGDGLLFGAASFLDSWASYPADWQGQKKRFRENKFLSTNVLWLRFNEIILYEGKYFGDTSENEFQSRQSALAGMLQTLNDHFYDSTKGFYLYYPDSDRYEGLGNALMERFGYNVYPINHPKTAEGFYPALFPSYQVNIPGNWYSRTDQHIWVDALLATLLRENPDSFCTRYRPLVLAYDDIKELIVGGEMLGGTHQLWAAVGLQGYISSLQKTSSN